jgi:AcrR family transcriptional regulator
MSRPVVQTREQIITSFLDAAERLLAGSGHESLSTRGVAAEARLNHSLVHYYFGSVDGLLLAVAERAGNRLIEREERAYATAGPFVERWRAAVAAMGRDLEAGDARVQAELEAAARNRPALREALVAVDGRRRRLMTVAFSEAASEYQLGQWLVEPMVALASTFGRGVRDERLLGIDAGHEALLRWFDGMLVSLQETPGA